VENKRDMGFVLHSYNSFSLEACKCWGKTNLSSFASDSLLFEFLQRFIKSGVREMLVLKRAVALCGFPGNHSIVGRPSHYE